MILSIILDHKSSSWSHVSDFLLITSSNQIHCQRWTQYSLCEQSESSVSFCDSRIHDRLWETDIDYEC
jgi:hypothetical protein